MEFTKIKLEILSPVHIGTGEALDPFSYVIKDEGNGPYLYSIDLPAWVEDHPNPEELAQRFSSNTMAAVRSFISENLDTALYSRSSARIVSKEIYDEYRKKLNDQHNQLKISPALKNSYSCALLIPGSSIKGAIRTAVIDYLDRAYKMDLKGLTQKDGRYGKEYTKKLEEVLGKIGDNDFKNLKVGDFEACRDDSYFVTAKEMSRNPNKESNTPKDPCEVTASRLIQGNSIALCGKIGIGAVHKRDHAVFSVNRNREKWNFEELMRLCNEFYGVRYRKEREKFYALSHFQRTADALKSIDDAVLNPKPGEMVLRIGHYSHVECMTITDNDPETRLVKGKKMPFGTTRTLAEGIYPFGWVKLSICSDEEYARYLAEKKDHDSAVVRRYAENRNSVLEKKESQQREREEKERLKREVEELEAKRTAELAAMSDEDRALFLLARNELQEHEVVKIFDRLSSLGVEEQRKCAAALKAYWQKESKWSKKDCSKKQWEKVQKIKGILGEG